MKNSNFELNDSKCFHRTRTMYVSFIADYQKEGLFFSFIKILRVHPSSKLNSVKKPLWQNTRLKSQSKDMRWSRKSPKTLSTFRKIKTLTIWWRGNRRLSTTDWPNLSPKISQPISVELFPHTRPSCHTPPILTVREKSPKDFYLREFLRKKLNMGEVRKRKPSKEQTVNGNSELKVVESGG